MGERNERARLAGGGGEKLSAEECPSDGNLPEESVGTLTDR